MRAFIECPQINIGSKTYLTELYKNRPGLQIWGLDAH